ncbi:MAG: hypothetical protein NXI10_17085 [bacterium]|nr:hypothetical protein [bacterium]
MRLLISYIFISFLATISFGQDILSRAKEIRDIEHAQAFADSLPQVAFGFMHDQMTNEDYQSRKNDLKPGDSYESGAYYIVAIAEGSKELYRFRLLTLTEQKTPNAKDEIRKIYMKWGAGTSFEELFDQYAENKGPGTNPFGDVGWVDLDIFVDSFQSSVKGRTKGDRFIAGDDASGWYNVVDMTHNPKKTKGHFILLIPKASPDNYFSAIDHKKNIGKLKKKEAFREYAKKHPGDVQLELLSTTSNRKLFEQFQKERQQNKRGNIILSEGQRWYQFIEDTSVQLVSIQYIYLDGSKITRDERSEAIHDIYEQFHSNVPFDSIVAEYWPDNNGMSALRNIETGLLAKDLAEKVLTTTVGQLFVARVGQSYFLGVPLEKPKQQASMLVISYPKLSEE